MSFKKMLFGKESKTSYLIFAMIIIAMVIANLIPDTSLIKPGDSTEKQHFGVPYSDPNKTPNSFDHEKGDYIYLEDLEKSKTSSHGGTKVKNYGDKEDELRDEIMDEMEMYLD